MLSIIIVAACLFLNAILSCAEMAFVTIDKRKLRKEVLGGSTSAKMIEDMQESPERILSVVQIGITLVGAISAAVSGAGADEVLSPWLMEMFAVSEKVAEAMALALVVGPLTVLSVVIGELVPKSVAIRYSFRVSILLAPGLKLAEKALGFLVNPMEKATNFLVDLFLPEVKTDASTDQDTEVSLAGLKSEQKEFVHNVIDLDAKTVQGVMVKWENVKTVRSDFTGLEVDKAILESGHTRLPVMDNNDVYGFIHLKEFLHMKNAGAEDNWLSYIRPLVFVTPKTKLLTALKIMKNQKIQILIVGTAEQPLGVVTLEDVIEEVVGDITDENEDKKIVGFLRHMVIRKKR